MENTNSKVVTISFMAAGILLGIVSFVLIDSLGAVLTGGMGRVLAQEMVRHGVPVALGLIVFLALQLNKNVTLWADDVVTELRKIVWPSKEATVQMTIMVCFMLVVSGILLGALDVFSGSFIDWLLHHNFGGLFS